MQGVAQALSVGSCPLTANSRGRLLGRPVKLLGEFATAEEAAACVCEALRRRRSQHQFVWLTADYNQVLPGS